MEISRSETSLVLHTTFAMNAMMLFFLKVTRSLSDKVSIFDLALVSSLFARNDIGDKNNKRKRYQEDMRDGKQKQREVYKKFSNRYKRTEID